MERDYTLKELIHNQSFRRMAEGTASRSEIDQWDLWMEQSDYNRSIAKEAMSEIAGFKFEDLSQLDRDTEWQRLHSATIGEKKLTSLNFLKKKISLKWIYRVAAIIVLAGVLGMGLYVLLEKNLRNTQVEQITKKRIIKTQSDEQKTIKFSNGSVITMNSNSMISYSVGMLGNNTIDVVLKGEAYFNAHSDLKQSEPVFAVHTPGGIIRDIGTQFMVTVQEDRSRVVLQKGQVVVDTKKELNNGKHITIQKGELCAFNKSGLLNKEDVNATFYTSWATGSMEFDQTTIQEFAGFVEQRFDVQVQVIDPRLANIQIDGGIYFRSLEELVRAVSEVAKIPAYQSADRKTIYIGNKNQKDHN